MKLIVHDVIKSRAGPEAGLPEHVRQALSAQRSAAGRRGQLKNSASNKAKKKTMFDGLYNALATRWDTDDLKDYTLLLTMKDRQVQPSFCSAVSIEYIHFVLASD